MKHPTHISYTLRLYPEELARNLADLRYDELAFYLANLAVCLMEDAEKDKERKRSKLADKLEKAAKHILDAQNEINAAWKICEPYMKAEYETEQKNN